MITYRTGSGWAREMGRDALCILVYIMNEYSRGMA